jgi:hypothetical protein
LPLGWKLCFSVEAKTICLTVSAPLDTLALALALAAAVAVAVAELELELELEHPAVPSRPAATVAPSQVTVRRLKMFTKPLVCDPSDARHTGVQRAGELLMARRRPNSTHLLNVPLGSRSGSSGPQAGQQPSTLRLQLKTSNKFQENKLMHEVARGNLSM